MCSPFFQQEQEGFCAKAWQVPGKGYYAAAGITDQDTAGITTLKGFKGNGAKTTTAKNLNPGEVFVVSQVGPLKNPKPWAVSDKASIAGAIFDDQLLFVNTFLYYFDEQGSVTVGYSGSAGETFISSNAEMMALSNVKIFV